MSYEQEIACLHCLPKMMALSSAKTAVSGGGARLDIHHTSGGGGASIGTRTPSKSAPSNLFLYSFTARLIVG